MNQATRQSCKYSIVIPARFASTRLPGKPLADIGGKPMVQRVYERARQTSASEVVVATDDKRIAQAVADFGGEVVMTRDSHPSGTDRLCEVAELRGYADDHIVVNLQGDEPDMPVAVLEQVATNLRANPDAQIATLCTPITTMQELLDSNAVKVVRDEHDFALYFSRSAIPFMRSDKPGTAALEDYFSVAAGRQACFFRHLGLYAYRARVLRDFVRWPVAMLETTEKLEQLRAMSNGVRIHCALAVAEVPPGIDSPADLERARARLAARPAR